METCFGGSGWADILDDWADNQPGARDALETTAARRRRQHPRPHRPELRHRVPRHPLRTAGGPERGPPRGPGRRRARRGMTTVDPRTIEHPLVAMELLLASLTRGDQHIAAAVAQRADTWPPSHPTTLRGLSVGRRSPTAGTHPRSAAHPRGAPATRASPRRRGDHNQQPAAAWRRLPPHATPADTVCTAGRRAPTCRDSAPSRTPTTDPRTGKGTRGVGGRRTPRRWAWRLGVRHVHALHQSASREQQQSEAPSTRRTCEAQQLVDLQPRTHHRPR
jgi:hypothetical protein